MDNAQAWFTEVKRLGKLLRDNGVQYFRIYSDKRKGGYKTKFYGPHPAELAAHLLQQQGYATEYTNAWGRSGISIRCNFEKTAA